jgi:hypothetical protein
LWSYETENFGQNRIAICGLTMGDHSKMELIRCSITGTVVVFNILEVVFLEIAYQVLSLGYALTLQLTFNTKKAFQPSKNCYGKKKRRFLF